MPGEKSFDVCHAMKWTVMFIARSRHCEALFSVTPSSVSRCLCIFANKAQEAGGRRAIANIHKHLLTLDGVTLKSASQ